VRSFTLIIYTSPQYLRHSERRTCAHSTMSHFPATPSNAGKHVIEASPESAMPRIEKSTSTSKNAQGSLYEPSPASTYGDTAGSSAPATPLTPEDLGNKKRTYYTCTCILFPALLLKPFTMFWLCAVFPLKTLRMIPERTMSPFIVPY